MCAFSKHEVNPSVGYPVANVPLGIQENGMPYGLALFAGRFQEDVLLER